MWRLFSLFGAMARLALLLLLIPSLSSATGMRGVLVDSDNCVHIRCEWRGEGKHCKPVGLLYHPNQNKKIPDATPLVYNIYNRRSYSYDEPKASILERIQKMYPVNTFTLVNDDVDIGEQCTGRRLWCTDVAVFYFKTYDAFLKHATENNNPPKYQC